VEGHPEPAKNTSPISRLGVIEGIGIDRIGHHSGASDPRKSAGGNVQQVSTRCQSDPLGWGGVKGVAGADRSRHAHRDHVGDEASDEVQGCVVVLSYGVDPHHRYSIRPYVGVSAKLNGDCLDVTGRTHREPGCLRPIRESSRITRITVWVDL
jgi:hypothetical protein